MNEYYPSFSADDKYLAFNSAPQANTMYYNADAEVYVVPSNGGTATRLKANDPASCATRLDTRAAAKSPGVTNSWARWSPEFPTCKDGKTYYWLIFSSWREGAHYTNGSPIAQLYVTAVVTDEINTYTYPAIYLWNQPANFSNHTPAWDVFQIPDVN